MNTTFSERESGRSADDADLYEADHKKLHLHATLHGPDFACIGMYDREDTSIHDANRRTVDFMRELLPSSHGARVLDLGSGYGGAARHLARTCGAEVTCINVNPMQNERNRRRCEEEGLGERIAVVLGSYEDVEELVETDSFDLVWSQDAMFFSRRPERIFAGVNYALRSGGYFLFSDFLRSESCSSEMLTTILEVQGIDSLCSAEEYTSLAAHRGFRRLTFLDLTEHFLAHFQRVLRESQENYDVLVRGSGRDFIASNLRRVQAWIKGAQQGHFVWGVFLFQRSERP